MPRKSKDEQLPLINVEPKEAAKLKAIAIAYSDALEEAAECRADAKVQRAKLLDAVHDAGIQSNPDGSCRFDADGCLITIKPHEDDVKVQFTADREKKSKRDG